MTGDGKEARTCTLSLIMQQTHLKRLFNCKGRWLDAKQSTEKKIRGCNIGCFQREFSGALKMGKAACVHNQKAHLL